MDEELGWAGEAEAEAPGEPAGEAPVDLGALRSHLGYLARRAQLWIFADFARTLAPLDITTAAYSVLIVVEANAGLSQSLVAQALGIERARLARLLHGLEGRGLVERRAAPRDRRSHALHLTREGRRLLAEAKRLAATHEAQVAERFGPERRAQLLALLQTFAR